VTELKKQFLIAHGKHLNYKEEYFVTHHTALTVAQEQLNLAVEKLGLDSGVHGILKDLNVH